LVNGQPTLPQGQLYRRRNSRVNALAEDGCFCQKRTEE
jgi:hypothetical protein